MPERFEIACEVTRDDWLAMNEMLTRISPEWGGIARRQRIVILKQYVIVLPAFCIILAWIGGKFGRAEDGALAGILLSVFSLVGLGRLDVTPKLKRQALERVRRADLSASTGSITASLDAWGARITTPVRELAFTWTAVVPHDVGQYVLLAHGGDGTIIPKRAFDSPEAADAFVKQTLAWWQAAQRPTAERIGSYLANRDVACPGCRYNLRGIRAASCPECGRTLTIQDLIAARQ